MASRDASHLEFVLNTPLGPNELLVESFSGLEGISTLFAIHLELVSENPEVDFEQIIGRPASLEIRSGGPLAPDESGRATPVVARESTQSAPSRDGRSSSLATAGQGETTRHISGIISRFSQSRRQNGLTRYRADLVPWLWTLTRTSNCRIFQSRTAPEILEQIFDQHGRSDDYESRLSASYPTRDYCVQYRETDLQFVSRLMEEEGIHYFFEHDEEGHKLILADTGTTHQPCPGGHRLEYLHNPGRSDVEDTVSDLDVEDEIPPARYALADYDFESPSTDLLVATPAAEGGEVYEYPGGYTDRDRGENLASIRLQALECQRRKISGQGSCRRLLPGHRFELASHDRDDFNREYILTSVVHSGDQGSLIHSEAGPATYGSHFECIASDVPFRPLRSTSRPEIRGCQTAMVVGPSGEEVWVDQYGRVKVRFPWDRQASGDETSSCWIRVSQSWAGKSFGAMFHPRIGQEVIVSFLEGDPDRPIITGRVYNGEQAPPYELPANSTRSTIMSRSSKGGDPSNGNEIRFEDKKGEEEVYLQAEKDLCQLTKNDSTSTVGHDRTRDVGNDETVTVGNDRSLTVGTDQTISVGGDESQSVGGSRTESIGGNLTLSVSGDATVSVSKKRQEDIGQDAALSVGSDRSTTVGGGDALSVGKGRTIAVGDHQETSTGKDHRVKAGKKVLIEAGDEITLKTGSASIRMKKNGEITIQGKKITVKGSGDVIIKGKKILQN